jgi:hypothetical protein
MALQRQNIELNLASGMDTKTDKKHVLPGKLTECRNAIYRKTGALDKRFGYEKISNLDVSGNNLGTGSGLAIFKDELLQYNSQKVYSYSPNIDRWVDKGAAVSAIITTRQVIKNTASQSQVDSAILNGIGLYAWEDSRGGVRASIIDETSGTPLLADVSIDASASRTRCLAFGQYLYVFYYKSGSLYVRRINPLSPTAFDSAVTVSSTVNTSNPTYDVLSYRNQRMLFAHNVQGASQIKVGWLSDVPAVLSGTFSPVTIAEAATNCLGVIEGPTSTFYVAYQNGTNGLRCTILNNGLSTLHAPFTVENITATDIINITGYKLSDDSGITFLYEKTAAATYNHSVRKATVTTSGTVSSAASDFMRSVGLVSKAFTFIDEDENSNFYVGVAHSSTLQSTYFVVRSDGLVIGKQQYTNAGGLTSRPILANVNYETDSIFSYAILKKNQITSENATIFTPTGVSKTAIDFTNESIFTTRQLGNNLLIVGGILNMYDAQSVVEHGFLLYPENNTIAKKSGGSLVDGTYGVIVLYEWTDNFGQIHRSQPSVATLVETSGSDNSISVVVPALRITRKDGSNRSNVSIVGYVTEVNGSTYYRYTSVSSPTFNDVTADTVALPDITSVSGIASNEILYTTGDVLPNVPAPACSVIEVFQNRIFLGGLEEENQIWFSKEMKANEPVEFNDTFNKAIEPDRGKVNAFAVLDDKILPIKGDRAYFTYGDGPNNTDTLGSFAEIQSTTIDIGTSNAKSIVKGPQGVMLKTSKGFYGIDGAFGTAYLGSDVEDYNDLSVSSATLLSDVDEIRFTTLDGDLLSFNYHEQKWSTFKGLKASDAVLWGNSYIILRTDGSIYKESSSIYKDNESSYGISLTTGWIAFAGVTGFKRVYRMTFLGEYKSPHKLRISVGYDYSEAWMHSVIYDPEASEEVTFYGDDSPYGNSVVYGGPLIDYLIRVDMKIQKCTAIRFKIEEIVTSSTEGSQEGLTISDIGLLVGIKSGSAKLKAAQTTGVS